MIIPRQIEHTLVYIYKHLIIGVLILFLNSSSVYSNDLELKIDPPFWWVGMSKTTLQLTIYGKEIGRTKDVEIDNKEVKIIKLVKAESPNYLFLYLDIGNVKYSSNIIIDFLFQESKVSYSFLLKDRDSYNPSPITSADVIYLITPDRFSNGDTSNDVVEGFRESKIDRKDPNARHGGDLKGIINHLDYISDLGITAIWLNPIMENDMDAYSYHGYAVTDLYKVDSRYGTSDDYLNFTNECHQRGIKVISDMIYNHVGINHSWIRDLPFHDWLNQHSAFLQTNYNGQSITDPYASTYDLNRMVRGWFTEDMPDLNQNNDHLKTYFMQNTIWWIENFHIDGIRMDTYPYSYRESMSEWNKSVLMEYPEFFIVGEVWLPSVVYTSYWQQDSHSNGNTYNSYLKSVSDFPVYYAINEAFGKDSKTIRPIYEVLAKDFLYTNPMNNKVFFDNHDLDRFFYTTGEDISKFKMAMVYILTIRGIPQIYYGTEMLMKKHGEHGLIRQDFEGGWRGDDKSLFLPENRNSIQDEVFEFTRKLLNWRKNKEVIHYGKTKHFLPDNELYIHVRYNDEERVVIIYNNSMESAEIDMVKYKEVFEGYAKAKDILLDENLLVGDGLIVDPNTVLVLELLKL